MIRERELAPEDYAVEVVGAKVDGRGKEIDARQVVFRMLDQLYDERHVALIEADRAQRFVRLAQGALCRR